MSGHPQPRRTPAGQNLPYARQRRIPLLTLAVVLALALLVSAGLLMAGCGSETTTTTAAPATTASTAAPSDTTTVPASGDTTTSVAAQPSEGTFPVTLTDDNGDTVTIEAKPMRIVSTAPASTETLFAVGAGDRVVGVTSLDDYPAEVASIAKVGDFQANAEAIMGQSPDLVIAYSGNEEALAPVKAAGCPVIFFNPATLDGIYANITAVGAATGNTGQAAALVESLKAEVQRIKDAALATGSAPKIFYAVDNTLWTAGPGSFVDELLKLVNAVNVGATESANSAAAQQYYQFAPEQLIAADPDVILLPKTAYKTIDEFTGDPRFSGLTAVKDKQVYLINDVVITRPGPRIAEGLKALLEAVHPGAM